MLNRVYLIGRLGRDPEIKSTANGGSLASFSIATNKRSKDQNGERREYTEWHNITVFDKQIMEEVVPTLRKGNRVYIEGELNTTTYEKEGQRHWSTKVVLGTSLPRGVLINCDAREGVAPRERVSAQNYGADREPYDGGGDIPF